MDSSSLLVSRSVCISNSGLSARSDPELVSLTDPNSQNRRGGQYSHFSRRSDP